MALHSFEARSAGILTLDSDSLEKLITSGRDSAMLRLTLARLLRREGRTEAAMEHAQCAVRLDPSFTAAWKELGQQRQLAGLADGARAAYQQGIAVARHNGDKQAEKEMTVFLKRLLKAPQSGYEAAFESGHEAGRDAGNDSKPRSK